MRPTILRMGGGEKITVPISEAKDYEEAVHKAMGRVSEFLAGFRIVRGPDEASKGDWYVDSSDCQVSSGGQALDGTFTFVLMTDDLDDE